MASNPRPPRAARPEDVPPCHEEAAPRQKAGRPPGPPSTIVNLRIPLALLARLDRYIDGLEARHRVKANRGMITRQALEQFLETHEGG